MPTDFALAALLAAVEGAYHLAGVRFDMSMLDRARQARSRVAWLKE